MKAISNSEISSWISDYASILVWEKEKCKGMRLQNLIQSNPHVGMSNV